MERLRDLVGSWDPAVAELARLVRSVGDLDPRLGAQARVRAAIAARHRSQRAWRRTLVVALLLTIVLPVVASVAHLVPWTPNPPMQVDPVSLASTAASDAGSAMRTVPTQVPPWPSVGAWPDPDEPLQPSRRSVTAPATAPGDRAPPERGTRAPAGSARSPVAAPPAPPTMARADAPPLPVPGSANDVTAGIAGSGGESLVFDALRALRKDHDAQSALRLLEAYRRRFPGGDLAEEALALTIETLVALGDSSASTFAEEYLRRFPQGRFREQAARAKSRFPR